MKWSLTELQKYQETPLHIEETLDLNASLTERFPDMILKVDPVSIDGYISYKDGDAMATISVKTDLLVPSSRSLTPVQFPIDFAFTEFYLPSIEHQNRYEGEETVIVLDENSSIDLDEAVAENIVLQIPLRVLSPEEQDGSPMPTGKEWEVVSEDEYENSDETDKTVDPRLAKLKELFPDQDDNNN